MAGWQAELLSMAVALVLVASRLSGIVMLMPGWGGHSTPAQVRVALVIALTVLVLPGAMRGSVPLPDHLADMAGWVAAEVVLGLTLGLGVAVLVSGVQLAGQSVSQMAGLQMAEVADPLFENGTSVYAKAYELTAVAVFFAVGCHRHVVAAVLDSLRWFPLGQILPAEPSVEILLMLIRDSFELSLRLAAPVAITLLLSSVIVGLISRAVPQLNVLVMGFSFNTLVLIAVTLVTIGGGIWLFSSYGEKMAELVRDNWLEASERFRSPRG